MILVLNRLVHTIKRRPVNIYCIIGSLFLYGINQVLLKNILSGVPGMVCNCYFNDLLCPLFFIAFTELVLLWDGVEIRSFWLMQILIICCGLIWEYVIPRTNAVADPRDLICYSVGAALYYALMRLTTEDCN